MAECNNLGRGPVVFELQQAGITAIRHKAAGTLLLLCLLAVALRHHAARAPIQRLGCLFPPLMSCILVLRVSGPAWGSHP